MNLRIAALLGLALFVVGSNAQAEEKKIPLKEVPKKVMKAVKANFPEAKIKGAEVEEEDDETVYEIALVNEGREVSVSVDEDGEIEEIEVELDPDDVPEMVRAAVHKAFPEARITSAERLIDPEEEDEAKFELSIKTEDGDEYELVIEVEAKIESKKAKKPEKPEAKPEKKKEKGHDRDAEAKEKPKKGKKAKQKEKDDGDE